MSISLPVVGPRLPDQRYSCHGCGNCCRDFTVQLRPEDEQRIREQGWERILGEDPIVRFRGVPYLKQHDDGRCAFLLDDGRCRIHAEHGFEAKPLACQLFPFSVNPGRKAIRTGLSFACQSVQENRGAELGTHRAEVRRMVGAMPEAHRGRSPMLVDGLRAEPEEVASLQRHADRWLRRDDVPWPRRLDGLAWIATSLDRADLRSVRGERFGDLCAVLVAALPEELDHHELPEPTARQRTMLRRSVFTRVEDVKIPEVRRRGRLGMILDQLRRNRRYVAGRGPAPRIGFGWPADIPLEAAGAIEPCDEPAEAAMIDDLMARYVRATILGGDAWGVGYYGWPVVPGLLALMLNVAAIGWLARLHAAGFERDEILVQDVRAAVGRIARTAGRAPWLGRRSERLRLRWLVRDEGLRRLLLDQRLTAIGD